MRVHVCVFAAKIKGEYKMTRLVTWLFFNPLTTVTDSHSPVAIVVFYRSGD